MVAGTVVALDPVRRLNASRNARRAADVRAIAKAIGLKLADTEALSGIDTEADTWQMLGTGNDCGVATCKGGDGLLSLGALALDGVNDFLFSNITTPFDIDPATNSVSIAA